MLLGIVRFYNSIPWSTGKKIGVYVYMTRSTEEFPQDVRRGRSRPRLNPRERLFVISELHCTEQEIEPHQDCTHVFGDILLENSMGSF